MRDFSYRRNDGKLELRHHVKKGAHETMDTLPCKSIKANSYA